MRTILKILLWLVGIIAVLITLCYITGNGHIVKGVRFTYLMGRSGPEIDDRDFFASNVILADDPQPWPKSPRYGKLSLTDAQLIALQKLNTVGFVVIKDDSLLFEDLFGVWRTVRAGLEDVVSNGGQFVLVSSS